MTERKIINIPRILTAAKLVVRSRQEGIDVKHLSLGERGTESRGARCWSTLCWGKLLELGELPVQEMAALERAFHVVLKLAGLVDHELGGLLVEWVIWVGLLLFNERIMSTSLVYATAHHARRHTEGERMRSTLVRGKG